MSDLKILLTADLNIPKSVEDINNAIKKIQGQIIKLKLEIDTEPLRNAQVTLNGLGDAVQSTQMKIQKVTNQTSKYGNDGMASLKNRVKEINKEIEKYGQIATYKIEEDGKGNIKSATISYMDATKKMVTERMQWQKYVNKVLIGVDENGKKQYEPVQKNIFKTTNVTYLENIKKLREETDKIYKNAINGLTVADDGKTFLNRKQADDIKGRYMEIASVVEKARSENRELNNEELDQVKKINAELDRKISRSKDYTKEIKRRNSLGTAKDKLDDDFDYEDQDKIRERVAKYYNDTMKPKIKVKASDVAVKSNIVDPQTMKQLAKFEVMVATGKNTFDKYKGSVDQASRSLFQFGQGVSQTANRNLDIMKKFQGAMQSIPIWMAGMTAFYQGLHFITDGIAYVNEMNKSLTQLSIVFNESQSQVAQWGEEFHKLGLEMSVSGQDLASGAVEFARQGLDPSEMIEKMKTATMYAKISNMEFTESAEILTATVNSMGVSAEHATDIFSYMGDATATGADEIGRAMQKVGGSAGALDINFEKVSSWIATISSRTRESAETIGNSVKSIIARVQSLKERGYDSEDGTTLNQVTKALAEVGVQSADAEGNFRNFGDVMDELGAKWSQLSVKQQAYVSTTVAGSYQSARFLTMMEGYPESVQLYEDSLNQAGIATQKFNKWQDGTEAKLEKMREAWAGVYQASFDTGSLNIGIEILTTIGVVAERLTKTFGVLPFMMATLTGAALFASDAFRTFYMNAGTNLLKSLAGVPATITSAKLAVQQYGRQAVSTAVQLRIMQGAAKGLLRTLALVGPMLVIMGASLVIGKLVEHFAKASQKAKELKQQMEDVATSYRQNGDEVESLVSEYKHLNEATDKGKTFKNVEQEERYYEVVNRLADLMPNLVKKIDEKGQAHLKNADAIDKELESAKKLSKQQAENIISDARNSTTFKGNDYNKKKEKLEAVQKRYDANTTLVNSYKVLGMEDSIPAQILGSYGRIKEELLVVQGEFDEAENELRTSLEEIANATMTLSDVEFSDDFKNELQDITSSLDLTNPTEAIDQINSLVSAYEKYSNSKQSFFNGGQSEKAVRNEALREMKSVLETMKVDNVDEIVKSLIGGKSATEDFKDEIIDIADATQVFGENFKNSADKMSIYNKLLQDYAEGKDLSASDVAGYIEKDETLIDLFKEENGVIKLNIEAVKKRRTEEIKSYRELSKLRKKDLEEQYQALKARLEQYGILLDLEADFGDTIKTINESIAEALHNGDLGRVQDLQDEKKAIQENQEAQEGLADSVDTLETALEGVGKTTDETNKKNEESIKIVTELQKQINKLDDALSDVQRNQGNYAKSSKEYRAAIREENKILEEKIKLIDESIADPSKILDDSYTTTKTTTFAGDTSSDTSSGGGGSTVASSSGSYSGKFADLINKYAGLNNVDPNLIAAIIQKESTFNPNATSGAGAQGLMQLMPGTAKDLGVKNSYDPEQNIAGGTKHFARLLKKYGDVTLALYAYNAGEGNVNKWLKNGKINNIPFKETKEYAPKVLENYKAFGGNASKKTQIDTDSETTKDSSSSSTSGDKIVTETTKSDYNPTAKELYDFNRDQVNQKKEYQQQIIDNNRVTLDSYLAQFENYIDDQDLIIAKSEAKASQLAPTSSGYRDELHIQAEALREKQNLVHEQAELIRNSGLKSDDLTQQVKELQTTWHDLDTQIKDMSFDWINSKLDQMGETVVDIDDKLATSQAKASTYEEGSVEWRKEMDRQVDLYEKKQKAVSKEADFIRTQLKNDSLSVARKKELNQILKELSLSWWELEGSIKDVNESVKAQNEQVADELIDLIKEAYEKRKEIALEALEEENKALEENHNKEMDRMDEEQKKFEEMKQARIDALEDQSSERTFNQELEQRQKAIQEIQNKLSLLSMDNSAEAKTQVKDLNKQLADAQLELENFLYDRNTQLEKDALQDEIDNNNKSVEEAKKAEDDKYEAEKERIEKAKEDLEKHYDEQINNERHFAELKKQILEGTTTHAVKELNNLKLEILKIAPEMGEALTNNFIDKITEAKDALIDLSNTASAVSNMMSNSQAWHSASDEDKALLEAENNQYGENLGYKKNSQGVWVDKSGNPIYTNYVGTPAEMEAIKAMKANSAKWKTATKEEKAELEKANRIEAKKIKGATYNSSTGKWYKNSLPLYHSGGIIGGSGDKHAKMINKMFNASPNEQVIMALKDELMVPSQNIAKNFMPNMSKLVSNITPQIGVSGSSTGGNVVNINIDKVTGDEKGANIVTTKIIKEIKKLGIKF